MTDATPGIEPETIEDALNAPEPAPEVQAEIEAVPEVKPEATPEVKEPFWYRKRLKEIEAQKKQAERRLQELEQQGNASQSLPDVRQDPITYFEMQRVIDKLERSEDRFVDKHGDQEFEAVKEWLTTRLDIETWALQQRHPWGAAYQQYQREKLSAEIGDDPNAWREKERERLRQELLAEIPYAQMATPRPNIPAPASGQRSTAARGGPAFSGPTPMKGILNR